MKLQARMNLPADSGEASPKLNQLRNRLLRPESTGKNSSKDGSIEVSGAETSLTSAPDYGTPDASQGQGHTSKKISERTNVESQLSYSVGKAFEPTRASQERWAAELATSLESLEGVEQSAAAALEPIKALYEHMRKLPYTFAPLRAFQEQLGVLAEAFAPMKALHQEVALMLEDSGAPFIQLAKSLELAKVSQQRIAGLMSTLETAAEMQAEFDKLAQAFETHSPGMSTAVQSAA